MALTDKQKRFADMFLIDLNATTAYKAIYKVSNDNTAAVNGQRLLRNAKVQEYLTAKRQKLAEKTEITQEMILEGYRKLAFYDVRNFYDESGNLKDIKDLDDETAFALAGLDVTEEKTLNVITGYTKKIKMSDRRAALDSICKVLGYNAPEKKDVNINGFLDFLKESSNAKGASNK
jgi:phage terminase small subunit